jgi:hypothetical protein
MTSTLTAVRHTTPIITVNLSSLPDDLFTTDFLVRVTAKPFFTGGEADTTAVLNKEFTAVAGSQRIYQIKLTRNDMKMPSGAYYLGATAFRDEDQLAQPQPAVKNFIVVNGPSNLPADGLV